MKLYLKLRPGETLQYYGPFHPKGSFFTKKIVAVSVDGLRSDSHMFSASIPIVIKRGVLGVYFVTDEQRVSDRILQIKDALFHHIRVPAQLVSVRVDMSAGLLRDGSYVPSLERALKERILREVNADLRNRGWGLVLKIGDIDTTFKQEVEGGTSRFVVFTITSTEKIYREIDCLTNRNPWMSR